jgi:hypothetical protein
MSAFMAEVTLRTLASYTVFGSDNAHESTLADTGTTTTAATAATSTTAAIAHTDIELRFVSIVTPCNRTRCNHEFSSRFWVGVGVL